MTPKNLLIIMSDEHNPDVLGCAGHPDVLTPNLDQLARSGVRYTNAVCASPICVPARAAFATGRNIFETGYWDNCDAYDGGTTSWHHLLRGAGHEVVSIGKLHYRGWKGDDYGFTETLLPMHLHEGRGEVKMLLRTVPASDGSQFLASAKAGRSSYTDYDESVAASADKWLRAHANEHEGEKPWVLLVSLVAPHFPLTAPPEFFSLYENKELVLPKDYHFGVNHDAHPYVAQFGQTARYNLHFKSEADVRRALSGYYGLVSYMDSQVGKLLSVLRETGLDQTTRILYTSDHGDNAGARGLWGKSTMYRESVGVPMIISGPEVDAGSVRPVAVSHIDVYASVLDAVGHEKDASTASTRSQSLFGPLDPDRMVLSEYHAIGSRSAMYMLQDAEVKYVHHSDIDLPDELFDLTLDPDEMTNLATDPSTTALTGQWHERLLALLDPNEVDARAKARQQELISHYGGREAILAGKGIGGFSPAPVVDSKTS